MANENLCLFHSKTRQELESRIAAEVKILEKVYDVAGDCGRWQTDKVGAELGDREDKGVKVYLSAASIVGSGKKSATEISRHMSPLVFLATYRVIDMYFEWLIEANTNDKSPWRFAAKIKLLCDDNFLSSYTMPPPLNSARKLSETLFVLYRKLKDFRGAMTHTDWGTSKNGNLHFDFTTTSGERIRETLTYKQVVDMAYLVAHTMKMVMEGQHIGSNLLDDKLLRFFRDRIASIIGEEPRGLLPPIRETIRYKVESTNSLPIALDIGYIRCEGNRNPNRELIMDLEVVACIENVSMTWHIPAEYLPEEGEFVIDEQSARFLVDQSTDTE